MNLIRDAWIEVERRSGRRERIAPIQLTADAGDPVVEVLAPRPDFRGALYQFLIALLQTTCAPRDLSEWKERWNEPLTASQLQEALEPYASAFELDGTGAAFMQDFDLLRDAEVAPITDLLIDTRSESNTYFNKPSLEDGMCVCCAATALFTLQVNAPAGGRGYQTSVRGGGPFTTLLMPIDKRASLWQKIWLNVRPDEALFRTIPTRDLYEHKQIFPWLSPTLIGGKLGLPTTPEMVSVLQCYWCMPRRIRLDFSSTMSGLCGVCGKRSDRLLGYHRFKSGGTDYKGAWVHPLTPYSTKARPGKAPSPSPFSTPNGGIGYKDWLGLTVGNDDGQPAAAQVVASFNRVAHRLLADAQTARLWCFGYDMVPGQAKARCWYDSTLPLHIVRPELQEDLVRAVKALIDVASEAALALHKQVMAAWFEPSKNKSSKKKEEPAVKLGFWQGSEAKFYALLEKIVTAGLEDVAARVPFYRDWLNSVRRLALEQFDEWVLAAPVEDMNMKRVVEARAELGKKLYNDKAAKQFWKMVNSYREEQV